MALTRMTLFWCLTLQQGSISAPHVDVFDGWRVYLVECGDTATVLFMNKGDAEVRVATMPTGAFDSVLREARTVIEGWYQSDIAYRDAT